MITTETKERFIILRAENKSYTQITKELEISKSSCIKLSKELNNEIAQARAENLNKLYNTYSMTKEARIKNLGKNLKAIDKALENIDYSSIAPEKLLDFKLKYTQALKEEYIPLTASRSVEAKDDYINQLKEILQNERDSRLDLFSSGGLTKTELQTELLLLDKIHRAEIETGSSDTDNEIRIIIDDKTIETEE